MLLVLVTLAAAVVLLGLGFALHVLWWIAVIALVAAIVLYAYDRTRTRTRTRI